MVGFVSYRHPKWMFDLLRLLPMSRNLLQIRVVRTADMNIRMHIDVIYVFAEALSSMKAPGPSLYRAAVSGNG